MTALCWLMHLSHFPLHPPPPPCGPKLGKAQSPDCHPRFPYPFLPKWSPVLRPFLPDQLRSLSLPPLAAPGSVPTSSPLAFGDFPLGLPQPPDLCFLPSISPDHQVMGPRYASDHFPALLTPPSTLTPGANPGFCSQECLFSGLALATLGSSQPTPRALLPWPC